MGKLREGAIWPPFLFPKFIPKVILDSLAGARILLRRKSERQFILGIGLRKIYYEIYYGSDITWVPQATESRKFLRKGLRLGLGRV